MANLSNINNKFIVEDSGDVGIGVTSATTKLHIGGTAPGDSIIRQDSTVSGTNWEIGERAAGKWQIFEDDGDSIVATFMSTGNVGIGTDSPTSLLQIKKATLPRITLTRTGILDWFIGNPSQGTSNTFSIGTNSGGNTEILNLSNTGNVGIGTSSPNYKLSVANASTRILSINYQDSINTIMSHAGSPNYGLEALTIRGDYIAFYTDYDPSHYQGLERMRIDSSGQVLIGDIAGTSPNGADRFLKIGKSNLQDCSIILQDAVETWEIYQNDDLQFSFGTTPSTVMTMQRTTGNVGIGTTNPQTDLHIAQSVNNTPTILRLQNADQTIETNQEVNTIQFYTNDTSTAGTGITSKISQIAENAGNEYAMAFYTYNSGDFLTERMRITNAGFVTIKNNAGVNNASLTFSNSDTGIGIDQSIGYLNFYSNDVSTSSLGGVGGIAVKAEEAFNTSFTPTYMSFYTHERTNNDGTTLGNVIERMRINSSGNVGIGETSPTKQLHLKRTSGDVRGIMVETTVATSYAEVQVKAASEFRIGTGGSSTTPNGQFYVYDATAGAHRFDIDANGNVGIGITSGIDANLRVDANSATLTQEILKVKGGGSGGAYGFLVEANNGDDLFKVNTLSYDSYFPNGNVGIGTTSPPDKLYVDAGTGSIYAGNFVYGGTDGTKGCLRLRTVASTGPSFIDFFYDGFSTNPLSPVGAIVTTGTATSYASFSDYRMKQNVNDLTNVLDKVVNLKPKTFNYKNVPNVEVQGFLAHELQEVIPQAVHGEKDEVHPDGNPKYQLVDHSHMIPLLTAAIKELKADNDSLRARIETLENK